MPIRKAAFVCLVAFFVLCPTGCQGGRKPVYPVHGKVTDKDNKPAVGAVVMFNPVPNDDPQANKPNAVVGEDGTFGLQTYERDDGAPAGEYVLTIEWRTQNTKSFGPNKLGEDQLKGRYSDPKTSKLKFTVEKKADNEVPEIRLD